MYTATIILLSLVLILLGYCIKTLTSQKKNYRQDPRELAFSEELKRLKIDGIKIPPKGLIYGKIWALIGILFCYHTLIGEVATIAPMFVLHQTPIQFFYSLAWGIFAMLPTVMVVGSVASSMNWFRYSLEFELEHDGYLLERSKRISFTFLMIHAFLVISISYLVSLYYTDNLAVGISGVTNIVVSFLMATAFAIYVSAEMTRIGLPAVMEAVLEKIGKS